MLPIALRIVCASLLTASLAACQAPPHRSPSSGGPGGQPPGPPPEAVQACEGFQIGDEVRFNAPDGRVFIGVCGLVEGVLAVLPPGGRNGPPR